MKKINFKQIDLLRKRREEDNLANPFFIETKKYIKKGIFIGLIIIAISLISGIPFIYRIKVLENKKNKIRVFSDEYDLLEKKLNEEQKQLNLVSSFNEKLKDSIWNISSSSALFKEIALIIPKDIQLISTTAKDNSLILTTKLPKSAKDSGKDSTNTATKASTTSSNFTTTCAIGRRIESGTVNGGGILPKANNTAFNNVIIADAIPTIVAIFNNFSPIFLIIFFIFSPCSNNEFNFC